MFDRIKKDLPETAVLLLEFCADSSHFKVLQHFMDQIITLTILREFPTLPQKLPRLNTIQRVYPGIELSEFMYDLFHDMGYEEFAHYWRALDPQARELLFQAVQQPQEHAAASSKEAPQNDPPALSEKAEEATDKPELSNRIYAQLCPKCDFDLTQNLPVFYRGYCPMCSTDTTNDIWQEFFKKSLCLQAIWQKHHSVLLKDALQSDSESVQNDKFKEFGTHEIPLETVRIRHEFFGHDPLPHTTDIEPRDYVGSFSDQVTNQTFSLQGLRQAVIDSYEEDDLAQHEQSNIDMLKHVPLEPKPVTVQDP